MNTASTIWNAVSALQSQYADSKKLIRIRDSRIRAMVDYAYRNVPYYHSTMKERGLSPSDIRMKDDLRKLPTITKSTILQDPQAFISRQIPLENCIELRSSGSCYGTVLAIPYDRNAILTHVGASQRWNYLMNRLLKRPLLVRQVYITVPGHNFQRIAELCSEMRLSRLLREFKFLSVRDPPQVNAARMKDFNPHLLSSYGSYLELLVRHAELTNVRWEFPKVAVFSTDTLKPQITRMLRENYGCQVFGLYGAAEALGIGFECEAHRGYHVCEDYYPVDLVSENGDSVGEGESGEVVVSNLINRAMVILNYRLGDIAVRGEDMCECERHLPMLSRLDGRTDDVISLPDGRLVGPSLIIAIFDSRSDIGPYQLVQEGLDRFELSLVPLRGNVEQIEVELTRDLQSLLGEEALIRFRFVDELSIPKSGKLRPVMSTASVTDSS